MRQDRQGQSSEDEIDSTVRVELDSSASLLFDTREPIGDGIDYKVRNIFSHIEVTNLDLDYLVDYVDHLNHKKYNHWTPIVKFFKYSHWGSIVEFFRSIFQKGCMSFEIYEKI